MALRAVVDQIRTARLPESQIWFGDSRVWLNKVQSRFHTDARTCEKRDTIVGEIKL